MFLIFEWLDLKSWLLCLFIVLILVDFIKTKDPPNFPPGPWRLPFWGNTFYGADPDYFEALAKKYGNICSLTAGSDKVVIVSGYKLVKEALITQLDTFCDRPNMPLFHQVFHGAGFVTAVGRPWNTHRKLFHTYQRQSDEGLGKVEKMYLLDSSDLCDAFLEKKGAFNAQPLIHHATGNSVMRMVFGMHFDFDDKQFKRILHLQAEAIIMSNSKEAQIYNCFPWLLKFYPGNHRKMFAAYKEMMEFLKTAILKHKETWDSAKPRDFVDAYLTAIEENKDNPEAGFKLDTLVVCTMEMLEAGVEGPRLFLTLMLKLMIEHPDVQRKVQAEIDKVVGKSRRPTWQERSNLPYTQAVIEESLRVSPTLMIAKMANKDTTLGGYFIPKGTVLFSNLPSVLQDEDEWEEAHTFIPERFLDAMGNFQTKKASIPFSTGRRVCLGERLGRVQLFIYFSTLLQRFTFSSPPGTTFDTDDHGPFMLQLQPR